MNIKDFEIRVRDYFGADANQFMELLSQEASHGFFLNTNKTSKEKIMSLIDFDYKESGYHENAYFTKVDNIGKTLAYDLGLIYPQDVESSFSITFLKDKDVNTIVDLCAAPGGKSINALNAYKDAVCISNDVTYARASIISNNFERLGFSNTLISSTKIENLAIALENYADLLLLDAPCSGEGMIRKYPEIIPNLNDLDYKKLEKVQEDLLQQAYKILKCGGYLIYSTCTYNLFEDEKQVEKFLQNYPDMELMHIDTDNNHAKLQGTIKLSPLNGTEGQYIAILRKTGTNTDSNIKYLKQAKNRLIESYIKDNINIKDYYLYNKDNNYYLSLKPLPDVKGIIRAGLYLGELKKDRFEPSYMLYRSNELFDYFKYRYELSDDEYNKYKKGYEIQNNLQDNYYLLTYKGLSFAYTKVRKGVMKNKYPKGLREI